MFYRCHLLTAAASQLCILICTGICYVLFVCAFDTYNNDDLLTYLHDSISLPIAAFESTYLILSRDYAGSYATPSVCLLVYLFVSAVK